MTRSTPIVVELQASATIDAAETAIGDPINVRNHDLLVVYFDYTKGDESGVFVYPKFLHTPGGDEHQLMDWTAAADGTVVQRRLSMTATGKRYATFDVRGKSQVKMYNDADGGSPTGTLKVSYNLFKSV